MVEKLISLPAIITISCICLLGVGFFAWLESTYDNEEPF